MSRERRSGQKGQRRQRHGVCHTAWSVYALSDWSWSLVLTRSRRELLFFSWARTFSGQRGSGGWVRVALTAPTVSSNHGLTTARIVTGWSDVDQLSI